MQHPGGFTYIMSNKTRTVFYIGVTSNIRARVFEHKEGNGSVFTSKYRCYYLVYYEWFQYINHAIEREKQLKNWHRQWKINLIKEQNPEMKDLYDET
ncbi:MAG: GIY-YIG nuclease family protein [Bacteroidetes bacterium]|nr:GIY-YIG nuclease family protein [Bacteroidota bacterium]MBU1371761.1 GIY-YIG nuclease family protein [Bacteroidota bacterium]MBU1485347.1 GIY-YIG nuclease family protein [Bacteroidota bacterium]MBU1760414.1 GIY-YIG nuclease family protein [Bacteroidota bacterium]MBU2045257.1 GIY-YIG nuclease family protein [Bacteroidota bacterium]